MLKVSQFTPINQLYQDLVFRRLYLHNDVVPLTF